MGYLTRSVPFFIFVILILANILFINEVENIYFLSEYKDIVYIFIGLLDLLLLLAVFRMIR